MGCRRRVVTPLGYSVATSTLTADLHPDLWVSNYNGHQMTELAVREDVGRPPLVRPLGRMPVAIPEDVGDRALLKAAGVVRLPAHIAWSPPYEYDLDDRRDLRCAYAQVMAEGLAADVRYYIDLDILVDIWDELYLPPHVRRRWSDWLADRGLLP